MLTFISALYNEETQVADLLGHVYDYVDAIRIVDDGSTDGTTHYLEGYYQYGPNIDFDFKVLKHTGLCEVARIKALEMCHDESWVLMLDADERFTPETLNMIHTFLVDPPKNITHVYFSQHEFIDGRKVAEFAKVKLFKKSAAHLPEIIHRDPTFDGEGVNFGGVVIHSKTTNKQIMRELQYKETYKKLLEEGKVTEGDVRWFLGMHHFVK